MRRQAPQEKSPHEMPVGGRKRGLLKSDGPPTRPPLVDATNATNGIDVTGAEKPHINVCLYHQKTRCSSSGERPPKTRPPSEEVGAVRPDATLNCFFSTGCLPHTCQVATSRRDGEENQSSAEPVPPSPLSSLLEVFLLDVVPLT